MTSEIPSPPKIRSELGNKRGFPSEVETCPTLPTNHNDKKSEPQAIGLRYETHIGSKREKRDVRER